MSLRETDIRKAILEYLFLHPSIAKAWQNDSFSISGRTRKSQYRPNHIPDVLGFFHGGRFLQIEVKNPDSKGRVAPGQLEWIAYGKAHGVFSLIAWSVSDVSRALEEEGYRLAP